MVEIISLEYDNTGLHYKEPEIKTIGYSGRGYKFKNISIPTLQVFLPKGKSQPSTAIVVCPGGGMKSNAFFHEGLDVAKALNEKGIAAFVLKYRLVPTHLVGENEGLNELYLKEKKQLTYGHLDALNAIAHVRENASKYSIDPKKIGIMGFSAGGAVTPRQPINLIQKTDQFSGTHLPLDGDCRRTRASCLWTSSICSLYYC